MMDKVLETSIEVGGPVAAVVVVTTLSMICFVRYGLLPVLVKWGEISRNDVEVAMKLGEAAAACNAAAAESRRSAEYCLHTAERTSQLYKSMLGQRVTSEDEGGRA